MNFFFKVMLFNHDVFNTIVCSIQTMLLIENSVHCLLFLATVRVQIRVGACEKVANDLLVRAMAFIGYSGFLHHSQQASHDLAAIWQKKCQ